MITNKTNYQPETKEQVCPVIENKMLTCNVQNKTNVNRSTREKWLSVADVLVLEHV